MTECPESIPETEQSRTAETPEPDTTAVESTTAEELMTGAPVDEESVPETTVVFVSRSRSLNLGGLVVLALVFGAIAGVVWGMVQGVTAFSTLVLGALYGLMFVGGGLAFFIVMVDWMMDRSRRGR